MHSSRLHNQQEPKFFTLGWEGEFNAQATMDIMNEYWYVPVLVNALFYLPLIVLGPKVMEKRDPIKSRSILMLWNFGLGLFSILGFIHVIPELLYTIRTYGIYYSICNNSFIKYKSVSYWHYLFALSKIPELVDTVFLVLRKQNLIFLHTYHHATVVLFAWFHHSYGGAGARWYNTMNLFIHSIMYTYYALKGIPHIISIPKAVSMLITTLQIVQMVIGTTFIIFSTYSKVIGNRCDVTWALSITGTLMYSSFLYLFAAFFYKAYLAPRPQLKDKNSVDDKKRA